MKKSEKQGKHIYTSDQEVQVLRVSLNMESDFCEEGNRVPAQERIRKELPVSKDRNSVIESLELTSLPVGLTDEYDSFVQSIQPFRLQNGKESEHKEKIYSSTFPKFERSQDINARSSRSPIHIAAGVTDSAEFSSTVNLTPLSVATLKEDKSSRQLWLDSMCLAAMSLTLSNIWRLPTFLYFNYTGEALIAYVILMTIVGLPLYVLELSLGQFGRTGIVKLWRAVPFFKGIGIAHMIAGLYQAFYFPTLMTWAFQFGIVGIGGWKNCESSLSQNLTTCLCGEQEKTQCSLYGIISEEEACFESQVLHKDGENMNYILLLMLLACMVVVTLSVVFGNKVMKILLSLSGITSVLLLSAMLALSLSHPNNSLPESNNTALRGIRLLTPVEPWGFGRGEVWHGAMVQVLFSLTLGFGTLPSQSSSSYFGRNIIRDGVILWLVNIILAIVSIIMVFAWIGISGLDASAVAKPNAFIYFVFYNISDSLWPGLTFLLLFLAGVNSMLPLLSAILQNLGENIPALTERYYKITCCLLAAFLFLLNIPGLIPAGNEVVTMWDHFAAGTTVLTCLIVHMIGWSWSYGVKNIKRDFEFMVGRHINRLWDLSWNFITIPVLIIAELWGFIGVPLDGTTECRYPTWLVAAGWCFYFLALAVALIFTIKIVGHQAEYGLLKKLANAMKPDRTWGPQDPLLCAQWKKIKDPNSDTLPHSVSNLSSSLKEDSIDEIEFGSNPNVIYKTQGSGKPISLVSFPKRRRYDELGPAFEY